MDFFTLMIAGNLLLICLASFLRLWKTREEGRPPASSANGYRLPLAVATSLLLLSVFNVGPRGLRVMGLLMVTVTCAWLVFPIRILRKGRSIALTVILVVECVVTLYMIDAGPWQLRRVSHRMQCMDVIASEYASKVSRELRKLGEHDSTSYDAGPLFRSQVWAMYGGRTEPRGDVGPEGTMEYLVSESVWHTALTGLYRVKKARRTLWYEGGKLSGADGIVTFRRNGRFQGDAPITDGE